MNRLFLAAALVMTACGGPTAAPQSPTPPSVETGPVASEDDDSATAPAAELQCGEGFGSTELTAEQATARYGENPNLFSESPSSLTKPIEVCGVGGELAWLMVARCNDTTNPFGVSGDAHAARVGSVGGGGRCGHPIDLYQVRCPEATYEVFMDLYMCGPSESLM